MSHIAPSASFVESSRLAQVPYRNDLNGVAEGLKKACPHEDERSLTRVYLPIQNGNKSVSVRLDYIPQPDNEVALNDCIQEGIDTKRMRQHHLAAGFLMDCFQRSVSKHAREENNADFRKVWDETATVNVNPTKESLGAGARMRIDLAAMPIEREIFNTETIKRSAREHIGFKSDVYTLQPKAEIKGNLFEPKYRFTGDFVHPISVQDVIDFAADVQEVFDQRNSEKQLQELRASETFNPDKVPEPPFRLLDI